MRNISLVFASTVLAGVSLSAEAARSVPAGCDPAVMSETYWRVWNDAEQAKIDADIEANRKTDAVVPLNVPEGTAVAVEQLEHAFRFGAHIFNYNQLGRTEWNDAYKARSTDGSTSSRQRRFRILRQPIGRRRRLTRPTPSR